MNIVLYLAQGLGLGLAAAAQPGPFQAYLIGQTLEQGWRRTLPAALAPLLSDGPIILLVLLVLSQVPAWLQRALYVAGGLFILYLAYSALKAWRQFDASRVSRGAPNRQGVLKAALMNALSPGPYIYWSLVTGPILITAWREAAGNGVAFLAGFYVAMVGCLAALIVVFATMRRLGPGVTRALVGVSAIALACFGVYQLWLGIHG
jgi:threonine/homoserine/homoserine lactone efflux protein